MNTHLHLFTIGRSVLCASALLCSAVVGAQSPELQASRQARSVHLTYEGYTLPAQIISVEATPEQVYPGTYLCLLGFNGGYAGIQEFANGKHVAIFSVWDPGDPFNFSAHPDEVAEHMRTKIRYTGKDVENSRFGGEGTGGKSMMPFAWEVGKPVRMAISMAPDGEYRTAYTCWIWMAETQTWFRMATFSTIIDPNKGRLSVAYSFLEDFLRNVESKNHIRRARFSRALTYANGKWSACTQAVFSGDSNLLKTIDAGPLADGFWLQTGGDTTNVTTKLWQKAKPTGPIAVSEAEKAIRAKLVKAIADVKLDAETSTAEAVKK
ncbi:MAG: DUF3472 domain-containing protein [Kiritimatiellia bacterium]